MVICAAFVELGAIELGRENTVPEEGWTAVGCRYLNLAAGSEM